MEGTAFSAGARWTSASCDQFSHFPSLIQGASFFFVITALGEKDRSVPPGEGEAETKTLEFVPKVLGVFRM